MKIFISADIEGTTGITVWTECEKGKPDYEEFQKQMTAEVVAACEGAMEGGAREIIIKDAHDTARNIIVSKLPENVKLIREWSGHPFQMVQGLDESFDAAIFTGYHSRAGSDTNPLAHTFTDSVMYIKVNGRFASEFLINSYSAAYVGVPVVMVTGDKGICEEAKGVNPGILTVPVSEGEGTSNISIHPNLAVKKIKETAKKAVSGDLSKCKIELPGKSEVEILYKDNRLAYKTSFYPGARLEGTHTIKFESNDYFDVLRLLSFMK
ncbi:MAG: M55 family metallopeptidase [Candidatus Zixiibacteriota bacterium]|nr:MAG: M55 family metallopeptidase [candidate division Zixibacteria bacterium]